VAVAAGSLATERSFLTALLERGRISPLAADRLQRMQTETGDRLCSVLLKLGLLSEADLLAEMSNHTAIEAADGSLTPCLLEGVDLNSAFLHAHEVVPLAVQEGTLDVAIWDALDPYPLTALEYACGLTTRPVLSTREEILDALRQLSPTDSEATVPAGAPDDEELAKLKDLASDAPVIRLVQRIISDAVAAHASDIHLEPGEEALHVRFRIDGLLREIRRLPKEQSAPVISRIKVMAGLNIAERRLPQDGRIRVTAQGREIDFRTACSPTLHGESLVLRILDRQDVALDFVQLGFDPSMIGTLRAAIGRPYGILLVTGPTGSGKTTTLYAALKEINTPDKKILTVEDPVEYVLTGVNQVPIKPQIGLTFAHCLRAFLRQDPDVLMVGEIRDPETAQIAIQAALTGHLLLSTLHTNTAAGAVTRLLDMGIDDYLLTSTLHVIIGQRLVRKLCAHCRQSYCPPADLLARFNLSESGQRQWFRARGCPACRGTGYKGRSALIEVLDMTDAVRDKVLARADAHEIERAAVKQGMRTLFQHGVDRIEAGVTSAEEVLRVTSLS
jgi:general secretion pathway protein E